MSPPLTAAHQVATQDFHLGWEVWALLGYAVLGPLFLTNILWFKSVDRVGPSHATLVANFQPFLAVAFAVPILNESLSLLQVLGGAGIMLYHPVEKWLRDAKVFQIVEGTSEIQRHVIAGYLRRGDV